MGITIKELKNKLRGLPEYTIVTSKGYGLRYDFSSYRGDYRKLGIEIGSQYTEENSAFMLTPKTCIQLLDQALSEGIMTGYKGGEFIIADWTEVVLASYGIGDGDYIKNIYPSVYNGSDVILFELM